jgi:hypothetical protein
MPRKPNYRFERAERDRAKATKKADRLKAKQDKVDERRAQDPALVTESPVTEPVEQE